MLTLVAVTFRIIQRYAHDNAWPCVQRTLRRINERRNKANEIHYFVACSPRGRIHHYLRTRSNDVPVVTRYYLSLCVAYLDVINMDSLLLVYASDMLVMIVSEFNIFSYIVLWERIGLFELPFWSNLPNVLCSQ